MNNENVLVVEKPEVKKKMKTILRMKLISRSSLRRWIPVTIMTKKQKYKCNFKEIGEQIKIFVKPDEDVKIKVGKILSKEYLINTSKKATFVIRGPGYAFRISVTPLEE